MGDMSNLYGVLIEKHEGKRPHGKTTHKRKNNMKINFIGIICDGVD
jgi:hypothetical protein